MQYGETVIRRTRVCFVQPVQSPYWTERLKVLARQDDIDITLLLEQGSFTHRPGWHPESMDGVHIEVLGSMVVATNRNASDMGYRTQGIRTVPWRFPQVLWRLRPDVVVLCNATQILTALPVRRLLGFRIVLMVEDTLHATRNLAWLARKLKTWAYRRADHWFVFSEDARCYLAHIGIKSANVEYSPWSLDMAAFKRNETRRLGPIAVGGVYERSVLFMAQFLPGKGLFLLLQAWADLPSETRSHVRLLLLGDGPLRDQAVQFCSDRGLSEVNFLGHVPYEQVKVLLGSGDLFVLPTLQDIYSLSVLEAMASGCPVVITPFAGARELVQPDITGWIVDPTEPGALAKTLIHALSADVDLTAMGRAARARVEGMNNVKVMSELAGSLRALAHGGQSVS